MRRHPLITAVLAAVAAVAVAVGLGIVASRLSTVRDLWVTVSDDTYAVLTDQPAATGAETRLIAGAGGGLAAITYLKFRVPALPDRAPVRRADLRLTRSGGSFPGHVELVRVPSNHWGEGRLLGATAPRLGGVIATARPDPLDGSVVFDVSGVIRAAGTYSFAVTAPPGDGLAWFVAKEARARGEGRPAVWLSSAGRPIPRELATGPVAAEPSSTGDPAAGPPSTGDDPAVGPSSTGNDPGAGPPSTGGDPAAGPPSTAAPVGEPPSTGGDPAAQPPSTGGDPAAQPPSTGGDPATGPPSTGGDPARPPSTGEDPVTGPPSTPGPPSTGDDPPAGPPSTGGDPTAGPPSSGDEPPVDPPSTGSPATDPPSTGRPATDPPSTADPTTGPPVTGAPPSGPPDPTDPPDPGCTVGDKLVPTCGVLWGVAPGAHTDTPRPMALTQFEEKTGRPQAIYHAYHRGTDEVFPTADEIALARNPDHERILFINWKPVGVSWARIARGDELIDSYLDRIAGHIKENFPEPFYFTVHHEPENDVRAEAGSGWTPHDYAAMFRHVVERLRQNGATNLVSVIAYMAYVPWNAQPWFEDLYPGDDVVDWIAWDAYAYSDPGYGHGDFAEMMNRRAPSSPGWPGFYNWAALRFPDKPVMLAEWGVWHSARNEGHKPYFFRTVAQQIQLFPRVKALVYFDTPRNQKGLDSRVDSTGASLDAYRRLGCLPIFDVSPGDAGRSSPPPPGTRGP